MGKSKFLIFEDCKFWTDGESKEITVSNKKDDDLGDITYDSKWKKWVFYPEFETQFSSGCLREIADKLDEVKKEEKTDG